jgi:amidase
MKNATEWNIAARTELTPFPRRALLGLLGSSLTSVAAACRQSGPSTTAKAPASGSVSVSTPDLATASACWLSNAIRTKSVSSLEVVDACLRRIEEVNRDINALVTITADTARTAAREADAALARGVIYGPLHGVPMTIKDSHETAGVVTTTGTLGRRSYVPTANSTAVERLRAAGAILLGKTNTPELTYAFETDNLVCGRTNNPYDLSRTPGGSSGGAAALLATGGSSFDLGSDTAGSIRLPAHWCGITGIKPTTGRVPRTGHVPAAVGLIQAFTQIGPMARWIDDLVLLLPIVVGADRRDPFVVEAPLGTPNAVDLAGLKVAVHVDNGIVPATGPVADAVRRAALVLQERGAAVEEGRPDALPEAFELADRLFAPDGGDWLRRLLSAAGTTQHHSFMSVNFEYPRMTTSELVESVERLDRVRSQMLPFMERYDALICPVHSMAAVLHGASTDLEVGKGFSYTMPYNVSGWPGVVVRGGITSEGLPVGVQILARPFREDVALAVAKAVEAASGGWQLPPLNGTARP